MRLRPFASLAEFHRVAVALLAQHEAEHGLLLGVSRAAQGTDSPADAYAAAATLSGQPVAVALRTTSKFLLSREAHDGAAGTLARDALAHFAGPHGVLGPPHVVAAYVTEAERAGRTARAVLRQGIYELRAVVPPRPVEGARRVAMLADAPVITDWQRAWLADAGHPVTAAEIAPRVRARIERGEYHLWDVAGRIVASAAADLPSLTGRRVNGVYTPPKLRGHGYASALVAALSQHLLDAGYAFTFLHTDLANATSNGIYERIGYRPVGEALEVAVDGSGASG